MQHRSQRATDRRIQRTHQLLHSALIDLVLERGYEALTIKDITERADIAYATFFRHYADKDALLVDILEEVIDELQDLLRGIPGHDVTAEGRMIFEHVRDHERRYRVLLRSQDSARLLRHVRYVAEADVLRRFPSDSWIPREIAAHHMITSVFALVQWWLENEQPFPPAQMARIYNALIIEATRRALATAVED